MPSDGGAEAWVRRQCERYRKHLLARKAVSQTELDEVWPADDASPTDWIAAYGQLRAWLWTQDETPGSRDAAEERVLKALREEPESVTLSDGRVIHVYPKSLDTLLWVRTRDWFLGWLNRRSTGIMESLGSGLLCEDELDEPASILGQAAREIAYQLAVIAAVACSPTPTLPDWVDREDRPPPRWRRWLWRLRRPRDPVAPFLRLDPVDLLLVNKAFREVNAGRLVALDHVVPRKRKSRGGNDALSWTVFVGTMAMQLDADPERLAKNRSLVSLVSQVRLSATEGAEELDE